MSTPITAAFTWADLRAHFAFAPLAPVLETFLGLGGNLENRHTGVDLVDKANRRLTVVVEVGQQIDLVEKCGIAFTEHQGIFSRFVFTFGYAQHHHPYVFTDVEFSRADQIADIFDNEQIDRIEVCLLYTSDAADDL